MEGCKDEVRTIGGKDARMEARKETEDGRRSGEIEGSWNGRK